MGEVPVLTDHTPHGDVVLSQSGAILDYLSRELDRFGPANEDERREILRWLLWDNHKLTSYTATYRFMSLFQKKTDDPVTQFFHARAVGAWKVLDAHLEPGFRRFDRHPTIADLSMCGYLFWPDQIGMDLTPIRILPPGWTASPPCPATKDPKT
jgi:glutathione S-transferase